MHASTSIYLCLELGWSNLYLYLYLCLYITYRKMLIYYRNWFMWLQRSRSLMMCHLQVREPGKLVVRNSFRVWRPKKQECQCLRAGEGGHPSSSLEQICPPSFFFKAELLVFLFFKLFVFGCTGSFSVATSRGSSLLVVHGLLVVWLLLFWSTGSRCLASVVVVPGL